ncbi:nuclear transport factor 2 family protein [Siccirubricoccus sp. KC 17139]|uniref:Nuclear transport factor 2 family protein n=1 Tax=Siccirubricoccus soli TaxID=2899147 RepID=A0ABT1D4V8_9PROT|nr:nuclear transport factor 2 family protein [Siccirubricoccus soli]MCO6416960.1 nuclear transport factor 2 family protein [Siccirubricoccus soli]MCP2683095.1 nuclear transport factor 2 family protein [Siccirubricoccus soli]
MQATAEIAAEFVKLCQQGEFDAAGERFWSDDIVSVEPMEGEMAVLHGRAAVKAKGEWWYANHTIHATEAHGPYVNGDQFAVRFLMDLTAKASGQRMQVEEIGLYTVRDGKIVEERFLFHMG